MPTLVTDPAASAWTLARRAAARAGEPVTATIEGRPVRVAPAFPSPQDWRDVWIYFLLTDRFNNPDRPPASRWNGKYGLRQGGTFEGIRRQLAHIHRLGARAIWLSPILKNPAPLDWEYNYPGYATQDFLSLDPRFASDGQGATAEAELTSLVHEAHDLGIYVILDVVLNHAGRVFDYVVGGQVRDFVQDQALIGCALGSEPPIRWMSGSGHPRAEWTNLVPPAGLGSDDAVWPKELQRLDFWRRRGAKQTDTPPDDGYIPGDFGTMRQLACEYDASAPAGLALREELGVSPVLEILIRCYAHAIARYDFDGLRIDTTKYLRPEMIESFGNAMREHALTIGKKNFFVFGEVWETSAWTIASFVGRHTRNGEGLGIDAALDFPLQAAIKAVVKGIPQAPVESLRVVFSERKKAEADQISSHGEAGRFFVSFIDNHDMHERFKHPATPNEQVTLALGLLFTLQGIPCVYYGTERGLAGALDDGGRPSLDAFESVREALWGMRDASGQAIGFGEDGLFPAIGALSKLRAEEEALRYGRLYFREASGNGTDFGLPTGAGGVIAFSRVLGGSEMLVAANTSTSRPWAGSVVLDMDIWRGADRIAIRHSNLDSMSVPVFRPIRRIHGARFRTGGTSRMLECPTVAASLSLAPMELQILGS